MNNTQVAPGELEKVRYLLNTWQIPNDTRVPVDLLSSVEDLQKFQLSHFPYVPKLSDLNETLKLRNDLRASLETRSFKILNDWLKNYSFRLMLATDESGGTFVTYVYREDEPTLCGELLKIVVESVAKNQWPRVKACPDCKWVHYDNTKNGRKVWCGMTKGEGNGRACGTIAKVNRWREKQRDENRHS